MSKIAYVPVTPGGSLIMHLEAKSEEEAWNKLLKDAGHMPYKNKEGFIKRGYTIAKLTARR